MNENKKETGRYEVVERYCPKCGENVIMRKTFGKNPALKCMNYENCEQSKDSFCGDSSVT
ncbi:MAG: hypothetical protein E7648_06550 [Ruminococcaceae bacterium]|nr:hypothetical protein [Oscillospiraceae bacterium]